VRTTRRRDRAVAPASGGCSILPQARAVITVEGDKPVRFADRARERHKGFPPLLRQYRQGNQRESERACLTDGLCEGAAPRHSEELPCGAVAAPIGKAAFARRIQRDGIEPGATLRVGQDGAAIEPFSRPSSVQLRAESVFTKRSGVCKVAAVAGHMDRGIERIAAIPDAACAVGFIPQLDHAFSDQADLAARHSYQFHIEPSSSRATGR